MADNSKEAANLIAYLRDYIKNLNDVLEAFKKGVGSDSWAVSMERSDRVFEAAARHEVFSEVVNALTRKDSKATLSTLRKYADDEVLRRAASPRHSSSPTANIMYRETLAAWAEVLQFIKAPS